MNDRECLICKKEFQSIKQHCEHFKICRSSLKCQKCDTVFDKLTIYHAHVTICNGLHKYKCSGCGKCFSEKKQTYNCMYKCRKKITCQRCSLLFQDWKKIVKTLSDCTPKNRM